MPISALIKTNIQSAFGSRVKHLLVLGILTNDTNKMIIGNPVNDRGPGLAAIHRAVCHRTQLVEFVAGCSNECGIFVMRRDIDGVNQRFGKSVRRYVIPGFAFIHRSMYQTIVGTDPNFTGGMRRSGDVADGVVDFTAGRFVGKRRAAIAMFLRFVASQVATDFRPTMSGIVTAKQHIPAVIQHTRILTLHR